MKKKVIFIATLIFNSFFLFGQEELSKYILSRDSVGSVISPTISISSPLLIIDDQLTLSPSKRISLYRINQIFNQLYPVTLDLVLTNGNISSQGVTIGSLLSDDISITGNTIGSDNDTLKIIQSNNYPIIIEEQNLKDLTISELNDGDLIFSEAGNGDIIIAESGAGGVFISDNDGGGISINESSSAGISMIESGDGNLLIDEMGPGDLQLSSSNNVVIQSLIYPNIDGTSGQVITTNGLGTLSFQNIPITGASNGLSTVGSNIEFGGVLTKPTTIDNSGNSLTFENGTTIIQNGLNNMQVTSTAAFFERGNFVVQVNNLGASLEGANTSIRADDNTARLEHAGNSNRFLATSTSVNASTGVGDNFTMNGNISLSTPGTITIEGLTYPSVDGTNGQVLTTNGLGILSFQDVAAPATPTLDQVLTAGNTTTNTATFTNVTIGGSGLSISANDLALVASGAGNEVALTSLSDQIKLDPRGTGNIISLGSIGTGGTTRDFQAVGSGADISIYLTPKGSGNVYLGNLPFDADQVLGAGQDNYVLTYDNGTGLFSAEAAGVSFGTSTQVPYMNVGGTDFIYTSNFTYTDGATNKLLVSGSSSGGQIEARFDGTHNALLNSTASTQQLSFRNGSEFTGISSTASTFVIDADLVSGSAGKMRMTVNGDTDTGTESLYQLEATINDGAVSTRPLFKLLNFSTEVFQIQADGDFDYNGNSQLEVGLFSLNQNTELTISAGAITITQSFHDIDTEADGATDDLENINGGVVGARLTVRATDNARTVVIKDGIGNIQCSGDFPLDNVQDTMDFIFDGTNWLEVSRSDNGA